MADRLTVTELNSKIHNFFEQDLTFRKVVVEGELSGVKYYSSGHIYFTLKDDNAAIDGNMWNSYASRLKTRIKDGDKVVITGKVSTYEKTGKISLSAVSMELDGQGDLYKKFLMMKAELEEMGYFDPMYKKPLPKFINSIGVVTAPTGSAIQDIIKISKERNPGVRIVVYPATVQGKGAENTIAKGIEVLDSMGFDVLIVGRGGGSEEDLWCFNEKIVADAIFNARTPVISAVGHQDHYAISDYVADLRAATPSDAAKNIYNLKETIDKFDSYRRILKSLVQKSVYDEKARLRNVEKRLILASPRSKLDSQMQRATDLLDALNAVMSQAILERKNRLEKLSIKVSYNHPKRMLEKRRDDLKKIAIKLDGLSPAKKLASGFSYVQDEDGKNIKSIKQLSVGQNLTIHLNKGSILSKVEKIND